MKKSLVLSLVLALAMVLILPTVAMAAPAEKTAFSATGIMTSIDEGTVKQLGDTGEWLVADRHIQGTFLPGSALSGDFTITYGGIFNILDQSGKLTGNLQAGSAKCTIIGETQPLTYLAYPYVDAGGDLVAPCLMIFNGTWVGQKGLAANGTFSGSLLINVYADDTQATYGHVKSVMPSLDMGAPYGTLYSAFAMTGQINKK